jgi:D-inositol-3-phosphate glycosyltransferase
LDPRKQPAVAIRAFAESAAARTHLLVLAGPDAYGHRSSLEDVARKLKIAEKIVFFGPAYGDEKAGLLQHAACLCLPSKAEGQPVVLLESIGAGTPVVFSRECNSSVLAGEGAGICLDTFSANDWADAIDRICCDPAARGEMQKQCRRIAASYTWDEVVRQWMALYRSIRL